MLEGRPMIRPANLLAFIIKRNWATPSHNHNDFSFHSPNGFCRPRQFDFMFANLWSFPRFFWLSVLNETKVAVAEEFNLSKNSRWGGPNEKFRAWSWLLSKCAIGLGVRRAQAKNLTSAAAKISERNLVAKKGCPGLRNRLYEFCLNLRYSYACLSD